MRVEVPYGHGLERAELPQGLEVEVVSLRHYPGAADETGEIERALSSPLGFSWESLRGAKTAVIVVSDLTRPVPNRVILPVLIKKLNEVGIENSGLTILIGAGLHRPAPPEEFPAIVGEEIANTVKVISHDAYAPDTLLYVATTSRGTPIWVNRHYLEAEVRIIVGMIDPHQFAGYSGGAKGLAIGCGGEATIRANHSLLKLEGSELGRVEGNPVREDIDEIGRLVGINLIVNVILNGRREIVKAVAGEYLQAHRAGVTIAREICEVPVSREADVVIASPGGFPKDINLYQAQKGLAHAARIVKEKGVIILCAECREGVGDDRFAKAMREGGTVEGVLSNFDQQEFQMGAHKAYLWCRTLQKARVILVSRNIDLETAHIMQVTSAADLQEAVDRVKDSLPTGARVAVLPKAGSTIPHVLGTTLGVCT